MAAKSGHQQDLAKQYEKNAIQPIADVLKLTIDQIRDGFAGVTKALAHAESNVNFTTCRDVIETLLAVIPYRNNPFFFHCNPFTKDFGRVFDIYGSTVNESNWRKSLFVLRKAESKFSPSDSMLTPAGAWLITIAHDYGFPAAAARHIEAPIVSVEPRITGSTVQHYCRYFYFLGLIQANYKHFEEACYMFEVACEVRAPHTINYAVLANRALFVVSAAARSETAVFASSEMKDRVGRFDQFAAIYLEKPQQLASIRSELHKQGDGLGRLVDIVCEDRPAQQILALTKIFANLPLTDVASSLGVSVADAKATLNMLVASGRIGAEVGADGIVTFSDVNTSSRQQVEETIKRAVSLSDEIQRVQTQVLTSRDYVRSTADFKARLEKEVATSAAR